jgi:hypothetical protein
MTGHHTYAATFTKVQTMCHDLVTAKPPGAMHALGINLGLKPTSFHPSVWSALPYYALVLIACALQFVQMWQMNRRNPGATQANPQMKNMQYFMPIIFAVIYINIQSAVVIYMIVSTIVRIVTQDVLFRTGVTAPQGEREIGGEPKPAPSSGGLGSRLRDALAGGAAPALVEGDGGKKPSGGTGTGAKGPKTPPAGGKPQKENGTKDGSVGSSGSKTGGAAKPAAGGTKKTNGSGTKGGAASSSGAKSGGASSGAADSNGADADRAKQQQNRARSKRARKAR